MLCEGWGETEPKLFFKPPPTVSRNPLKEVNQVVVSTDICKNVFDGEKVKFTILKENRKCVSIISRIYLALPESKINIKFVYITLECSQCDLCYFKKLNFYRRYRVTQK